MRLILPILLSALLAVASAAPAAAQSLPDRIARELRAEGYTDIRAKRTLLGRIRITGSRSGATREVVIDPARRVILRDYVRVTPGLAGGAGGDNRPRGPTGGGGGASGTGGGIEEGEDEEDDDEDDGEDEQDEEDDEDEDDDQDEDDEDDEEDEDDEDDDDE